MAMNGLDKITDRILSAANGEADRILAGAQAECDKISSEYASRAAQIKSDLSDKAEREGTDIVTRARSAAANQKRNLLLQTKSELVDEAFDDTLAGLLALSDEKYTTLLVGLLSAAMLEQIDAENDQTTGEKRSRESDRARVKNGAKEKPRRKASQRKPWKIRPDGEKNRTDEISQCIRDGCPPWAVENADHGDGKKPEAHAQNGRTDGTKTGQNDLQGQQKANNDQSGSCIIFFHSFLLSSREKAPLPKRERRTRNQEQKGRRSIRASFYIEFLFR